MEKIEEYTKEIPEEIKNMIAGLDNDYRVAIFVALYKHGELSFSELLNKLGISKAKLNYHLVKLMESALVHHYYKHELGAEDYSFYNITNYGQSFFENMNQLLNPRKSVGIGGYDNLEKAQVIYLIDPSNLLTSSNEVPHTVEVGQLLENSATQSSIQFVEASFTELKKRLLREYAQSTQSNQSTDATS